MKFLVQEVKFFDRALTGEIDFNDTYNKNYNWSTVLLSDWLRAEMLLSDWFSL